jgi:hypothetical protein
LHANVVADFFKALRLGDADANGFQFRLVRCHDFHQREPQREFEFIGRLIGKIRFRQFIAGFLGDLLNDDILARLCEERC